MQPEPPDPSAPHDERHEPAAPAPAAAAPARSTVGDFLFKWRGELAGPFMLGVIALGRPVAWSFLAGLAVTIAGELIRIAALRHIGSKSRRTGRTGSSQVVRSGPYAWTRNPLYLGNLIMTAGVLLALNRPVLLGGGILAVAVYYRTIIGAEERALAAIVGDEYRRYLEEVPRLFPRPPRTPSTDAPAPFTFADFILPELNTIVTLEVAFALAGAVGIWHQVK